MATSAQIAANRRNAQRSTGPKSAEGQARSARNARKHGLSALPTGDALLGWFRMIVGDPEARLDNIADSRTRAALALAKAELRLEQVLQEEARRLSDPERLLATGDQRSRAIRRLMKNDILNSRSWARATSVSLVEEETPITWRILERYRREAEAGRHKALRAWIAVEADSAAQSHFPEQSQFQP